MYAHMFNVHVHGTVVQYNRLNYPQHLELLNVNSRSKLLFSVIWDSLSFTTESLLLLLLLLNSLL